MHGLALRAADLADRVGSPFVARHGLKVQWFAPWHPLLDEALQELPEMETCPHELFRLLMLNPGPSPKRAALVTGNGQPLAVVGLRRIGVSWEPVGQGVVPRATAPARDGHLYAALNALGVEVRFDYWKQPPPSAWTTANSATLPIYRARSDMDFESYWRSNGHIKAVRPGRNRTRGFRFEVDRPGSIDVVTRGWVDMWRGNPAGNTVVAGDRIVAGEYLQKRGLYHAFTLWDGETPVAGNVFSVDGSTLLWQHTFRSRDYDWHCVGTRGIELAIEWAAQTGPWLIDFGGGHAYKEGWAPRDGQNWGFSISPAHVRLARRALTPIRGFALKVAAPSRGRATKGVTTMEPTEG